MNLKIYIGLYCLLFVFSVQAQKRTNIVEYFDKDWKATSDTTIAQFYRTIDEVNGIYIVKDFFWSDTLQMIAECSSTSPKLNFDGKAKWYFSNGRMQKEAFYEKNSPRGVMKTYYENGTLHSVQIYGKDKYSFCQYWNSEGVPMLVNGTGFVIEETSDFMYASHREVKDSTVVASYSISKINQDTLYVLCDKAAAYKGGQKKLYKGLSEVFRYPAEARRFGIEGRVFVQFVVNEQGQTTDVKVIKGLGYGCDEAAMDAISKQNKWIPANHKGKPVKSTMVIPMAFKLK
jgi:TonB family protein